MRAVEIDVAHLVVECQLLTARRRRAVLAGGSVFFFFSLLCY